MLLGVVLVAILLSLGISEIKGLAFGEDEINVPKTNDELMTINDCVKFAQKIGDLVQDDMGDAAFNLIYSGNYVRDDFTMAQKNAEIANAQATTEGIKKEIGSSIRRGFEFVSVSRMGESFITVYFSSKHQYGPVPWRFLFYKPSDRWKILNVNFGLELLPEFINIAQPVDFQKLQ